MGEGVATGCKYLEVLADVLSPYVEDFSIVMKLLDLCLELLVFNDILFSLGFGIGLFLSSASSHLRISLLFFEPPSEIWDVKNLGENGEKASNAG